MLNALTYELLVLMLLGASGVASGVLFGIRQPIVLAATAVGFGALVRLVTALGVWFSGNTSYLLEAWAVGAAVIIAASVVRWKQWAIALRALAIFIALGALSLAVKYVLEIGEMQHTDSTDIVSRALLVIQSGSDDLSPLVNTPKRGLLYPLLLSLGPLGRIFSAVTPLLFFSTTLLTVWLSWRLTTNMRRGARILALAVVLGFLATVPIVRISVTYLNSHMLVAFGLTVMVAAVMLTVSDASYTWPHMALFTMGGMVAGTSRVEAIVLMAVIAVMFASILPRTRASQLKLLISLLAIGGTLLAWLAGLDTPISETFGVSYWALAVIGIIGAAILSSRWINPLRQLLPYVFSVALLVYLLWTVLTATDLLSLLLAQWPNFGLGAGGWATTAPALLLLLLVLGWGSQRWEYRWLVTTAALLILSILLTKTFDGGFGRESFYDSVNRMVLHLLPLVVIASVTGTSQIFDRSFFSLTTSREKDPHGAS
jgi:hypothetical protein